jgi:AcrR family transcriptional regulator
LSQLQEAGVPASLPVNILTDPFQPLPMPARKSQQIKGGARRNQRARRAQILASTRRLLTEQGCEEVTVRGIARTSGFALQTIYNLVGPRDLAITDAISEYSLYLGRMAANNEGAPSLRQLIEMWMSAAEACPEFARQCNLIMFTPSRHIYYRFRDIQIRGMAKLLRHQQENGHFYFRAPPRQLAEQMVFFATAIWIDWADRPYPFDVLREKLVSGFAKLLRD